MMKHCNIAGCSAVATWEGTLDTLQGGHECEVTYCDSHAESQMNGLPEGLRMQLSMIDG